jgi:hypothetical protein
MICKQSPSATTFSHLKRKERTSLRNLPHVVVIVVVVAADAAVFVVLVDVVLVVVAVVDYVVVFDVVVVLLRLLVGDALFLSGKCSNGRFSKMWTQNDRVHHL